MPAFVPAFFCPEEENPGLKENNLWLEVRDVCGIGIISKN